MRRSSPRVPIEDWRQGYNHDRPHPLLGMMTPAAFATGYRTYLAAAAASAELHDRCSIAPFDAGGPPYRAVANQPPALIAGGPMNGVVRGNPLIVIGFRSRAARTEKRDSSPVPLERESCRHNPWTVPTHVVG